MKVIKKLNEWANANLISPELKNQIIEYEKQKQENDKTILYSFMGIGAFAISIGIISLIAYNWHEIGQYFKLLFGTGFLFIFAFVHIKIKQKNSFAGEFFLIALFLGLLGYIGLIGQVYNLSSEAHLGFLFWGIISFPLIFLARTRFIPMIWFINFYITACIEMDYFSWIFDKDIKAISIFIVIIAILLMFWNGGKKLLQKYDIVEKSFSVTTLGLIIFTSWSMDIYLNNFWFMVANILFMGIWAVYGLANESKAMFSFFITAIIIRIIIFYVAFIDSLLEGGIALIISGIILTVLINYWHKNKTVFKAKVREMLQ